MIGDISGTVCSKNGATINDCKMVDIKYCKENTYNLFSITKCLKNGWSLHSNNKKIWITKGQQKVVFNTQIPAKEGLIFAVYINGKHNTEMANAGTEVQRDFCLNINKAHGLLGHADEERCRAAAKNLGWVITCGKLNACELCAVGKAHQKNVPKESEHSKSTDPGKCIFLDISTIKQKKDGPKVNTNRHWRVMVDKYSSLNFTIFFTSKSKMIKPTLEQINWWKQSKKQVKFI
eukprot:10094246-Ditylum_brightwellii.AAC.1